MTANKTPPILREKHFDAPSAFTPENLLREARRQKGTDPKPVPSLCILDPDGDIVRALRSTGRARRNRDWVRYHTEMDLFDLDGLEAGIVGCAVGASFAVLVAEEVFASGCTLLISITSSGPAAVSFWSFESNTRDQGDRIWQRYTATSSSGMRFASRRPAAFTATVRQIVLADGLCIARQGYL